jgi:hypothetical protein
MIQNKGKEEWREKASLFIDRQLESGPGGIRIKIHLNPTPYFSPFKVRRS